MKVHTSFDSVTILSVSGNWAEARNNANGKPIRVRLSPKQTGFSKYVGQIGALSATGYDGFVQLRRFYPGLEVKRSLSRI